MIEYVLAGLIALILFLTGKVLQIRQELIRSQEELRKATIENLVAQ